MTYARILRKMAGEGARKLLKHGKVHVKARLPSLQKKLQTVAMKKVAEGKKHVMGKINSVVQKKLGASVIHPRGLKVNK